MSLCIKCFLFCISFVVLDNFFFHFDGLLYWIYTTSNQISNSPRRTKKKTSSKTCINNTYVQRLSPSVALLTILFSKSGYDQVRYCLYKYYLAKCHTENIGLGEILYAIHLNDTPVFDMLIYFIPSVSVMLNQFTILINMHV